MHKINILDSGMGSELILKGQNLPKHIWSAYSNLKNPDLVYNIHKKNINSGATIITTNTFRTTPRSFLKLGLSKLTATEQAKLSMKNAVKMAKKASKKNITILGSIAPLEDCYESNLFPGYNIAIKEYKQLGQWLIKCGVDGIILETMNSIIETESALSALKNLKTPIHVSFYLIDELHLESGETLIDALIMLRKFSVKSVLINCLPLDIAFKAVNNLVSNCTFKWGIYPNLGIGKPSKNGIINKIFTDEDFKKFIVKILPSLPSIVGGCCGSSSKHIKLIKKILNENKI